MQERGRFRAGSDSLSSSLSSLALPLVRAIQSGLDLYLGGSIRYRHRRRVERGPAKPRTRWTALVFTPTRRFRASPVSLFLERGQSCRRWARALKADVQMSEELSDTCYCVDPSTDVAPPLPLPLFLLTPFFSRARLPALHSLRFCLPGPHHRRNHDRLAVAHLYSCPAELPAADLCDVDCH